MSSNHDTALSGGQLANFLGIAVTCLTNAATAVPPNKIKELVNKQNVGSYLTESFTKTLVGLVDAPLENIQLHRVFGNDMRVSTCNGRAMIADSMANDFDPEFNESRLRVELGETPESKVATYHVRRKTRKKGLVIIKWGEVIVHLKRMIGRTGLDLTLTQNQILDFVDRNWMKFPPHSIVLFPFIYPEMKLRLIKLAFVSGAKDYNLVTCEDCYSLRTDLKVYVVGNMGPIK